MSLSRKDFQAIAQALTQTRPDEDTCPDFYHQVITQWESDCLAIATSLSLTNPNFNKPKFLAACTLTRAPK